MRSVKVLLVLLTVIALASCSGQSVTVSDATPNATKTKSADAERVVTPDVVGMSVDEARSALEGAGLAVETIGDGDEVTVQVPSAGISVEVGTSVAITLESTEPSGTRDDPYVAGSAITGSTAGADEATIVIGSATWGADAAIAAENQFNEVAPDGSTYVLVPVTIKNIGSVEAIVPWLAFTVAYVAPDGRSFDEASAVIPGELSDLGDLYEGGEASGNLAYLLPIDAQGGVWAVTYGWSDPVFVAAS